MEIFFKKKQKTFYKKVPFFFHFKLEIFCHFGVLNLYLKFKGNSVFDTRFERIYTGGVSPTTGIGSGGKIIEKNYRAL